ncbi:MAG: cytochrome c oxidase subunit 4, partial [Aquihabitans sp.]
LSIDDFWHRKYGEDEDGRLVRLANAEDLIQKSDGTGVHLPSPSYWPIVLAFGLPWIAYGLIYNRLIIIIGVIIVVGAMFGWVMEPESAPGGHDEDRGEPETAPTGDTDVAATVVATETTPEAADAAADEAQVPEEVSAP